MKHLIVKFLKETLLVIILIFIVACKSDDIEPELLTGGWTLEQIIIEGSNSNKVLDQEAVSVALFIDEDHSYYRNYVTGVWSLNDNNLVLDASPLFNNYWECSIIKLTENVLELQIKLTEQQYLYDFDQFSDDEILTITESYVRSINPSM
ncbi:MAG: hypothetical protein ACJA08_002272 [Cyclobacteriaceae bacterium]|jgi:hypothetical protein